MPGLYSRCASFSVGQATAVAMSPDGRIAALATGDGIVRVVEVASRQVVAVLPSPRAMIDYVAFAPDGRAILTLARAQREVTLWRSADWTPAAPVWTTILPGHRYDQMFGGGLAFAPDARSVVVSPGTDVFVLDAATGAVRASSNAGAAVLDVAYGLDGSRIVVALPSLAAHCNHVPNGGTVALFDANLQLVATLADLGSYPGARGIPAFRVSPDRGSRARRAGHGGSSRPARVQAQRRRRRARARAGDAATRLHARRQEHARECRGRPPARPRRRCVARGGGDDGQRQRPDGRVGGRRRGGVRRLGGELLRIWRTGEGAVTPVCAAEPPAIPGPASLSADGQLLAIPLVDSIRVLRRSDGAKVMWLPSQRAAIHAGRSVAARKLHGDRAGRGRDRGLGRRPVAQRCTRRHFAPDSSGWLDFLFTPSEEKVYSLGKRSADTSIDAVTFDRRRAR